MNLQGKYWCFSLNNPTDDPATFAQKLRSFPDFAYLGFQAEQPETYHYQGYVEFHKCKRLSQLKAIDDRVHWERRKGTQQQARDYCILPEYEGKNKHRVAGPWEYGTPVATAQGQRNDLLGAIENLRTGGIKRLVEENPEMCVKFSRGFNFLASVYRPVKVDPEITLLYGPSGCGKTHRFWDVFPDDNWATPSSGAYWFDGYMGQSAALLDELEGRFSQWKLGDLLRVLDRYPLQVPIKGGFTWWTPSFIYVTCNIHPVFWYDYAGRQSKFDALARRFHAVIWWKSKSWTDNVRLVRPSGDDESVDLLADDSAWEHFWSGPTGAQLELDKESGTLVANCINEHYDF